MPGGVEALADLEVARNPQATPEGLWRGGEDSMAKLLGAGAGRRSGGVGDHVFPAEEVQEGPVSGLRPSAEGAQSHGGTPPPPPDDNRKKREEAAKKGEVLGWAAGGVAGFVPGMIGAMVASVVPAAILGAGPLGLVYGGLGLAAALIGGAILVRGGMNLGSRVGSKVGRAVGKVIGWIVYR